MFGESVKRVDAADKVTGQAKYPGDLNLPGQAYMRILICQSGSCNNKKN